MVIEIYFLFAIFSVESIFEYQNYDLKKSDKWKYFIFLFALILVTGLRDGNATTDYLSYEYMYDIDYKLVEPTFSAMRFFTKNILHGSIRTLMVIYAFLAILLKWIVVKKYTSFPALSFVVLLGDLFMQQDFTQIRAAVAIGVFLLSLRYIYTRNLKKYLLMMLIAVMFHTSSLLMLPLYFLNPKKINKYLWLCFIFLGYVLTFIHFNPMEVAARFAGNNYISQKLLAYTEGKKDYTANVLSIYSFSKLLILLILYWKINIVRQVNKYGVLLIKIQSFSFFFIMFFCPKYGSCFANFRIL